ncbi:MAG: SAM-dependent chlorinase/fluorinase [Acidimicrobiia bacterium]|nr:SAM-dependent chlorinase/fluorinase [Acidimicrobiia bacterium]
MSVPISFLSDFGYQDEFVGVVHGVLARIAPNSRIIDISHGVAPGDVRAGALTLMRAIQYLPQGVALAVVDPGVGTARTPIAAETPWGFFVGPDNGLLSPAVAMVGGATRIVTIENPDLVIPSEGATFDGRDRFGPAAAALATGEVGLSDLGSEVDPSGVMPLMLPLSHLEGGILAGQAWWIDRFGNAQTNVSPEELNALGIQPGSEVTVKVESRDHTLPWVAAYGDAEPGKPLVHVDSYGLIALAVREGRADEWFGLSEGTVISFISPD